MGYKGGGAYRLHGQGHGTNTERQNTGPTAAGRSLFQSAQKILEGWEEPYWEGRDGHLQGTGVGRPISLMGKGPGTYKVATAAVLLRETAGEFNRTTGQYLCF